MKIIALEAENLKRLTAVHIEPDGNLVQITGKNGHGKTSVLDAIWWALDGKEHVQAKPIRQGEEQAIVRLDLGDLVVTRKFRAKEDGSYTTSITVENAEGARFPSPQTMLDELLGELTFDPLAFTRMKADAQVHALRSLVPDFDFAAAEQSIKEAFDKRAICNRDAREARAAADAISRDLPDDIPEVQDVESLREKWADAVRDKSDAETQKARINHLKTEVDAISRQIEQLQTKQKEYLSELDRIPGQIKETIDPNVIKSEIDKAESSNQIAEKAKQRDARLAAAAKSEAASEDFTNHINAVKQKAKDAIAKADMPVSGLSISDGQVFLDGIPFDQASDAQQLQASIGIAMALNPKLKVIRVRDGSLLDEDAMKVLAQMADDRDYQIWIERVDSSGKIGFVLEDGHLKTATVKSEGGLFGGQEV